MARTRYSSILADLRGLVGNEVFVRTRSGPAARPRPKYRYPVTPNVAAGNTRLRDAMSVWRELTFAEVEAWRGYAELQVRTEPVTQRSYPMTARTAFTGLATKFLQINPSGDVPRTPPTATFAGEDWSPTVSVLSDGLRVIAGGPNSPGDQTEILIQRLPNVRCSPKPFYRSAGFVTFESGSLQHDFPLPPGVYAVAYRFVRVATGQATADVKLGIFEVVE